MAKIINLFNHKGGVSKTTTVFNLSWMLATMGKRVIIADFDPQCNLTGMATLGIAQELSGSLLALRNMPGSIRFLLDATAAKYDAEYVFVDMSPSLGPMNQNLPMTGDHFIVPLHPDYFSSMALSSLAKTLPRWKTQEAHRS
jgi:cellulose biosynthesis protein BcsQ